MRYTKTSKLNEQLVAIFSTFHRTSSVSLHILPFFQIIIILIYRFLSLMVRKILNGMLRQTVMTVGQEWNSQNETLTSVLTKRSTQDVLGNQRNSCFRTTRSEANLIVAEDSKDGHHHSRHVHSCDRIPQGYQRGNDHCYPLQNHFIPNFEIFSSNSWNTFRTSCFYFQNCFLNGNSLIYTAKDIHAQIQ